MITTLGLDETGHRDGVLQEVLDAAVWGERIAVLDVSPPFVRIFDADGRYSKSLVREGEGPGEAERPVGLDAWSDDALLVGEAYRVTLIDSMDNEVWTARETTRRIRGAARGCRSELLRLVTAHGGYQQPGAVTVEAEPATAAEDTVAHIESLRANTMREHPFFSASRGGSIVVLYPEQVDRHELLIGDCGAFAFRSIAIDTLGTAEYFVLNDDGTHGLYPPEPPHPAGVARIGSDIVWAIRDTTHQRGAVDSVTVFTLIGSDGARSRRTVTGWFELLDSDDERVLLGADSPVPQVLVVRAPTFVARLKDRQRARTR